VGDRLSAGGRKRQVLKLNSDAGYLVAVDLEGTRMRFGLTNLVGDIRYRWEQDVVSGQRLAVEDITAGIQVVLGNLSSLERSRVLAAGVSYTGMVDKAGLVTAVNIGWDRFPLAARLRESIDLPLLFGGNSKILAERWLGVAKNSNNCVFVTCGIGVGAAFCVNGHVLTGEQGLAGEFGHITVDPSAPDRCNCGKTGCLEAIASSPNIVRQYLEKTGRSGAEPQGFRAAQVYACARAKDPVAVEVVERAARYMGLGLSHVVNILNPALIVLGGDLIAGQDLLIGLIRRQLELHCLPELVKHVEIRASSLGHDSGLKGASSWAFSQALRDDRLRERLTGAAPPRYRSRQA
jgi:glucokinase